MVANDIGNKVEKGVTKTREVASQVPSRSLSSAQHLGNFALAGAGFGAGMVMNAKSHFQNVDLSLPIRDQSTNLMKCSQQKHLRLR